MKRRERSWMCDRLDGHTLKSEFLKGVEEFVKFCKLHHENKNPREIRCPCPQCKHKCLLDEDIVRVHLYKKGFVPNYYDWLYHGERIHGASSSASNPYQEMVVDAFGSNQDDFDEEEASNIPEEPNAREKQFFDLLESAKQPLYDGSKMSVLELASRTTALKCEYNLAHRCVDGFTSLLNEVVPENNNIRSTFYDTKKVVKGLELPHHKIHACPKGCMLFWKGDAELQRCKICDSERYKKTSRGTLVPLKVLTYFPITPRLQILFSTKNVADEMTWHAENPRIHNTMAHPSDSEAWKHFDRTFPDFASEPRNVRLGLCTDGFTPHGKFGGQYSCWPVILTPYNLPFSMCMKKPFMFLSLLILGPKNPKGNLDVYMQPLIEELKQLWETGATTYDISRRQNFNLRAAILWTISDFPAYGMLLGWTTTGKKTCPYCMDKSKSFWLKHGGKVLWFDCHCQFLDLDHPYRRNRTAFCKNRVEKNSPPHIMSGDELWHMVKDFPKATDGPEALKRLKKVKKGWFKQTSFWELPYWKHLLIRYNLDVMHIEKNFFDQLIHTVMDVKKHTSDTATTRKDLAEYCKRPQLELIEDERGKDSMPKAPFTLEKAQKKVLCEWVRNLRFLDGYDSNLTRCVDLQSCKLHGMKSHDCHVFMERLLPVALKELLPNHVWKAITEISQFFRDLCSSTITLSDMEHLESNIAEILCKLEKIFPPSFFNSMEHLPVHLPYEARLCGPVHYRWMYPFEWFLNHLKRKVGNKAHVEGSICNAYLCEEIANFCSKYFQPEIDTKSRDLGRNVTIGSDLEMHDDQIPEMFRVDCGRVPNDGHRRFLDHAEYDRAHLYVLSNSGILGEYERQFEEHVVHTRPSIKPEEVWEKCEHEFPKWFKSEVLRSKTSNDVIRALAMGPFKQVRCWSQLFVNGYDFQTYDYGKNKSTLNYGVCVSSQDEVDYFGLLDDVIEVVYIGNAVYRTLLVKCKWMDSVNGVNVHEQYKLVEINHTKRYPKYDPFVLSYQETQVYFAPYPSLKRDRIQWWAVFKTKARSTIESPVDMDFLQQAAIEEAPALCAPDDIPEYIEIDFLNWKQRVKKEWIKKRRHFL